MSSRMQVPLPRVGDVIAGKYAIVRVLGEGGMGIVYEASHVRLRQRVAIKMLLPAMLAHDVLVSRFEREARAAAQLKSRHVARVMDVDLTPDGLPYMVMEFLEGRDLQAEIDERRQLPFAEAVDFVLQACAAMTEAHALGIVHRDLKPSNLFLADDAGARVVKVLDFGISKVASEHEAKLTDADAVMGTALYMSPEQVRATSEVDARSDIWALGVILYEALAGRPPFLGSSTQVAAAIVTQDVPDPRAYCAMPDELALVLHKALQREPRDRFSDVGQLAVALAPFALPGTIGRAHADALALGPRSGRALAGADHAPTIINLGPPPDSSRNAASIPPGAQAPAISESRLRDRTAPGWSEHGAGPKKSRGLLFAGALGAVVALIALGGAIFVLDSRTAKPAQSSVPNASSSAASPSVADEPLPPVLEPAPPPTGRAEADTPVASASAAPVRPAAPVNRPAPSAKPTPPGPTAKPSNGPSDKPLFL